MEIVTEKVISLLFSQSAVSVKNYHNSFFSIQKPTKEKGQMLEHSSIHFNSQ